MDFELQFGKKKYVICGKKYFYKQIVDKSGYKLVNQPWNVGCCDGLIFVWFSNEHYTIFLKKENLIWIDVDEYRYLKALGIDVYANSINIFAAFDAYTTKNLAETFIYISSGLSRGAMAFHYGHFLTDFLPSISWLQNEKLNGIPILAPTIQLYSESLLKLCGLTNIALNHGAIEYLRSFCKLAGKDRVIIELNVNLLVADIYPQINYHAQRNSLISKFTQRIRHNSQEICKHKADKSRNKKYIVYFYRSVENFSRRVGNQEEVISLIKSWGGHCTDPSSLSITEAINLLDNASHCLVDAGSAAYLPLMFKPEVKVGLIVPAKQKNNDYIYPQQIDDFESFKNNLTLLPAIVNDCELSWNSIGDVSIDTIIKFST
jgi:capsular polysaccharide biosynthesis protein